MKKGCGATGIELVTRVCGIGGARKWWVAKSVINKSNKVFIEKTLYKRGFLILDGHEFVEQDEDNFGSMYREKENSFKKFINWRYREGGKYLITKKFEGDQETSFMLNHDLVQTFPNIWEGVSKVGGKKMFTSIWFRNEDSFAISHQNHEVTISEVCGVRVEDVRLTGETYTELFNLLDL